MEPELLALDVALLLPAEVAARAEALCAALPSRAPDRVRLGPEQLPHITLTQQFIRVAEIEGAFDRISNVVRRVPPLRLRIIGGAVGGSSAWMAIERTNEIAALHEGLMDALRGLERPGATAAAFADGDARARDVLWVAGYRLQSSFRAFTPHVTLGHAEEAPFVEPAEFSASTVAACHLGRFCTCRRVLKSWTLQA